MQRAKRDKIRSAALASVVVGVLVVAFALSTLLLTNNGDGEPPAVDVPLAQPSVQTPAYAGSGDLGLADQAGGATSSAPAGAAGFAGAGATLQGLGGEGGVKSLPKMRITLTMTSAEPIAYVGYIVPTSQDHSTGTVKSPGTSWSLTTIGYGPPDYAQLFSLAGPTGVPVTCTITVNGKVTERRSTSAPYDQLFCQG